eukprot:IDg6885t1
MSLMKTFNHSIFSSFEENFFVLSLDLPTCSVLLSSPTVKGSDLQQRRANMALKYKKQSSAQEEPTANICLRLASNNMSSTIPLISLGLKGATCPVTSTSSTSTKLSSGPVPCYLFPAFGQSLPFISSV